MRPIVILALGNHHDAGVSLPSTDLALDDRCTQASDCADGNHCNAGHCVFAADSGAAHKAAVAGAPNGVYWINDVDGGAPEREFCDMLPTPAQAICSPRKLTRKGFARDGSQLTLSFLNGAITPQYTYGGPYTTGTSLTTTATTTPSVSATCKTGFVLQLPLDDR